MTEPVRIRRNPAAHDHSKDEEGSILRPKVLYIPDETYPSIKELSRPISHTELIDVYPDQHHAENHSNRHKFGGEDQLSRACEIVVAKDGSGDFTKIQEAIDASSEGARIFVREGTFNENLTINKLIELVGSGWGTVISDVGVCLYGWQSGEAIKRIFLSRLLIDNFDVGVQFGGGGTYDRIVNSWIKESLIANCTTGIYFRQSASVEIDRCTIHDCQNAVMSYYQNNNSILNSYIYNCTYGFLCYYGDYNYVLFNKITNCEYALYFNGYKRNNRIYWNYLAGNNNLVQYAWCYLQKWGIPSYDVFINVHGDDDDYVHTAINGTGSDQNITTGITNPDVPRNITVKYSSSQSTPPSGTVRIHGINAHGKRVTEDFSFTTIGTIEGKVPFAIVNQIDIPSSFGSTETVEVGIGHKLGLSGYFMPHDYWGNSDVYKVNKNGADFTGWSDDPEYWTVNVGPITTGDNFTIYYIKNLNILE